MLNKLMETDRRKNSDGENTIIATAIVKMFAKLQTTELLFILTLVFSIILLASCKKDDVIQTNTNTNQIVGEWYEVGSTENRGTKVVFTETNVTSYHYFKDYDHYLFPDSLLNDTTIFYDNLSYNLLPNNEIQMKGCYPMFPEGEHITQFAFYNDTLFIKQFTPTFASEEYPYFLVNIYLVRRKNEN